VDKFTYALDYKNYREFLFVIFIILGLYSPDEG
jgi:hypothetical protein